MKEQLQLLAPPSLTDVLNQTKRNLSTGINCINIGIIQSFDIETQSATIQLALRRVTAVYPDGTRTVETRPLLKSCPCFVLCGGSSYLTMPITEGDECLVLFNDRELDQWYANGGVQTPIGYRVHSSSDAFALVGIKSLQNSIADYLANGVRLALNGEDRIDIISGLIASFATLFKQTGDMEITGNLTVDSNEEIKGNSTIDGDLHIKGGMQVDGIVTGTGGSGAVDFNSNITLHSGKTLSGGVLSSSNGASGTFNIVTVVNGIVTSGS